MTSGQVMTMADQTATTTATTEERDSLAWPGLPGHLLGSYGYPLTPLWEWAIARDETGASAGICHTEQNAIQAITHALTQARRPRTGQVTPVLLTDPAHKPPCYLRGRPQHTAVFDGKAIQWT